MAPLSLARCLATVASGEKLKVLSVLYRAGDAASNEKLLGKYDQAADARRQDGRMLKLSTYTRILANLLASFTAHS